MRFHIYSQQVYNIFLILVSSRQTSLSSISFEGEIFIFSDEKKISSHIFLKQQELDLFPFIFQFKYYFWLKKFGKPFLSFFYYNDLLPK